VNRCVNNTTALGVSTWWEFPWDPRVPWESHGNGNCGAKLMGIEIGMGIVIEGWREWEFCF